MVGVARESDLVLFWIMLAIFVVLPTVMNPANGAELRPVEAEPPQPVGRRARRVGRTARRERRGRGNRGQLSGQIGLIQGTGIVLVAAVVIFIGWLSWDKNVEYAWAAALAASARDDFQQEGNYQVSAQRMSKAIDKAPDVPIYYHNLAGIYEAYGTFGKNNPDLQLQSCAQFFLLEPRANEPQPGQPFARCAEEAYRANLAGFKKNPTSPQVKLVLANSSLELALAGFEGKDEEAIGYFQELGAMLPSSWPLRNALGTAYLRLGQFQEALEVLDESLSFTGETSASGQAIYLKGLAYRRLEDLPKAIDSFERSLAISSDHPNADNARRQLASAYDVIAVGHLQQNTADRAKEALAVLDKYLALPLVSDSSARPLYLKGVAYQQINDLPNAADSLEEALSVDEGGPLALQLHQQLAAVYAASGDQVRADEHARLFRELSQPETGGEPDTLE